MILPLIAIVILLISAPAFFISLFGLIVGGANASKKEKIITKIVLILSIIGILVTKTYLSQWE